MSVIIRLQNLPWSANALDIRQYFQGLSIPEGGVHIVGGELGDAFIAFSTDEDARQAMLIDGGKIKEVKIKLFLSSRSEMQKVIETARAQSITMQTFMQMPPAQIPTTPVSATQIPPTPSQTAPAMPPINQMPVKTPEIKPPPLPPLPAPPVEIATSEIIKSEPESEKKDQDTESVSSKDTKRSRRGRSRTKSRDRSKSRERSRSRSRDRNYRSKDRYRDRRRRDRSRSRDRRDRRRYRDRSRSRDRNARKVSKDRRRDSDRNSSENNNSAHVKNIVAPEKEVELPTSPMPSKPGFSNSGWVAAGSTEKSGSPLTNPIGFSIGKPLLNSSMSNQTQSPKSETPNSLQIPLPQQSLPLPTSQQISTSQPVSISHPSLLPQPPPFPQLPLEVPKDESGNLKAIPFPPNQQSTNSVTPQHGSMFLPNQPQLLQSEANKVIHQGQPGPPLMMPPGWNPNMLPMVGNPHLLLGPMPANIGINSADKPPMPMMNVPMGMYIRPPTLLPNENMQSPHLQNDPRLQASFNMQQQRNDFRDNNSSSVPQINNFNSQNLSNYSEGRLGSTNQRDAFLNTSVEIRNMSMSTTNIDIRRFFQGLQIPSDGVKIIADKKGNKVGMAYVRFSTSIFKDMALKKSGQLLKNSIVEVLHIDDNIFDKASDFSDYPGPFFKDNQNYKGTYDNLVSSNEPTEPYTDLIIHDVPPFSKDRDIYNLFKGFNIEDAFVLLRTGRKTATGYVRFQTPAEARRAMAISSRLSIGYTNVKVAICYEHEFSEARDRKNMEEDDEDMMDPKGGGYSHENRGARSSKKYSSYDYEEDELDSRYNQIEKRSYNNKALLPTPHLKPFDERPSLGNQSNNSNSFNSRYDRRQQDPSRTSKDFHKKPYIREDFHQKPYLKESGRFQTRLPPRDEFGENRHSAGENNKKSFSHSNFNTSSQDQSKNPLVQQMSLNTPTSNKDFKEPAVNFKATPVNSDSIADNDKEIKNETNKSKTANTQKIESHKSNTDPQDTQLPQTKEEITEQKQKVKACDEAQQNNTQPLENENQMDHGTDCIILRGLPFNANDRDILDFFSDEGLAPTQIHIMLDKLGQPAGDAFCEFNTVEEVSRALTKNRTLMGRSVVAVEPVPREEMKDALGVVVPIHPPEFSECEFPERNFPERFPHPEYRRPDYRYPQRGRGFPPHFPPRGRGRGGFRIRHHAPTEIDLGSQNVNSFGKPGCVLALENVPFRAEVQDILDFFKGFFVTRDNVIRRFDENGKSTGDARVCLNSPEDANRALRTLNQRQIYNRQIHLSLL